MSESEANVTETENEFVIFLIGEQEYCIDIMSLREIRGWTAATSLPDAPDYVNGVINLRGAGSAANAIIRRASICHGTCGDERSHD